MKIEDILKSPEELEKLTDQQLIAYFEPCFPKTKIDFSLLEDDLKGIKSTKKKAAKTATKKAAKGGIPKGVNKDKLKELLKYL